MATPKAHIGDMPTEVLVHICSFLSPDCAAGLPSCRDGTRNTDTRNKLTLARLSLTCRRLRDVAQPILFHCFPDFNRGKNVHRLICLDRTLAARPDLAQHIKYIQMRQPLEDLSDDDQRYVEDAVLRLGLPAIPSYWNIDGEGPHYLLPLELVLLRTPHLLTLHVPLDYNWDLHLIPQLLSKDDNNNHDHNPDKEQQQQQRPLPPPPFLPHLRRLEIDQFFIAGDRFECSSGGIDALTRAAPALQTLCLSTHSSSGWAPHRAMPALRALHLDDGVNISADTLAQILAGAPGLEVLTLDLDMLADYEAGVMEGSRSVETLWEVLEGARGTLRELWLDVREDTVPRRGQRTQGGVLIPVVVEEESVEEEEEWERDSLADFEKLEVLRVDGHALDALRDAWERKNDYEGVDDFLVELFPPGIREVTFWRLDGGDMRDAMRKLAKVVAEGKFPKLEKIRLAPSQPSDSRWGQGWVGQSSWEAVAGELTEEFAKGGVKFEVAAKEGFWRAGRFFG